MPSTIGAAIGLVRLELAPDRQTTGSWMGVSTIWPVTIALPARQNW